jgi:histidyl-tRNA synthetase
MEKLSTLPYKGSRDFYPNDQNLQNYIFETWRKVCRLYGFSEYNGPFLEPFELYEAKSGQELVTQQLYSFEDRGGRKVAIRPEMTPTVARMVAATSKSMAKPIKWFSIANFWRYERPQRGRLREFFQLNVDIFGENSILADFEVFSVGPAVMRALGATSKMYEVKVNNRIFMDFLFDTLVGVAGDRKPQILKAIDRKDKMGDEEFRKMLLEEASLNGDQVEKILEILKMTIEDVANYKGQNKGADELIEFFELSKSGEFSDVFVFDPKIVRGLDYYTGLVIEQWDKNPENNRSMYGGGRYDDLTDLFEGAESLPATGFAMGDVTLIKFLESWNLTPEFKPTTTVLISVFPKLEKESLTLANKLRSQAVSCELYLSPADSLDKQLKYADKKQIPYVLIVGENEMKEGKVTLKELATREQITTGFSEVEKKLKQI